jgi:hypothetical protein
MRYNAPLYVLSRWLLAALTDHSICWNVQQALHSTYSMFGESLGPLQRGSYPSVSEDADRNSRHPSVSEEAEINSRPSSHSPPSPEVLAPQPLYGCYACISSRNYEELHIAPLFCALPLVAEDTCDDRIHLRVGVLHSLPYQMFLAVAWLRSAPRAVAPSVPFGTRGVKMLGDLKSTLVRKITCAPTLGSSISDTTLLLPLLSFLLLCVVTHLYSHLHPHICFLLSLVCARVSVYMFVLHLRRMYQRISSLSLCF